MPVAIRPMMVSIRKNGQRAACLISRRRYPPGVYQGAYIRAWHHESLSTNEELINEQRHGGRRSRIWESFDPSIRARTQAPDLSRSSSSRNRLRPFDI